MKARYFRDDGYWTFRVGDAELAKPDAIPITRFTKVTGGQTPYDPAHCLYWRKRMKTQVTEETYSKQRLMLHRSQEYACVLCGVRFVPGETIQIDHIISKEAGRINLMKLLGSCLLSSWQTQPLWTASGGSIRTSRRS